MKSRISTKWSSLKVINKSTNSASVFKMDAFKFNLQKKNNFEFVALVLKIISTSSVFPSYDFNIQHKNHMHYNKMRVFVE